MADPDKIGIGKISQSETGRLVARDPWLVKQSMLDTRRESRNDPPTAGFDRNPALLGQESRIVEDIGEVRHTKAIQDGFSIAVELTGLSDSNVSELIRATNAASIRTNVNRQDSPDSAETEEKVSKPMVVQGD